MGPIPSSNASRFRSGTTPSVRSQTDPAHDECGAEPKACYIYIASRGHSGSTLLELLLGGHPELVCVGELQKLSLQFARAKKPYPGLCSCGRRPFDCDRWRHVVDAVWRQHRIDLVSRPFDFRVSDVGLEEDFGKRVFVHWLLRASARAARYVAYSRPGRSIHVARCLRFNKRWVENRLFVARVLRETTGAHGVIDSSKDPLGMCDLVDQCLEPVKVIFLTRDPRSSVHSTMRRRRGAAEPAARDWVEVNRTILRLLNRVARRQWLHLKYEDLCADVSGTCRQLCRFLGYEYHPRMLDLNRADRHTISGNLIRFEPIGCIREDDAWKSHLSAADLRRISEITGRTASALGYDVTSLRFTGRAPVGERTKARVAGPKEPAMMRLLP